jgi:hypothetical protein
MHESAAVALPPEHIHPDSTAQVELHPSLLDPFPSSQVLKVGLRFFPSHQ